MSGDNSSDFIITGREFAWICFAAAVIGFILGRVIP